MFIYDDPFAEYQIPIPDSAYEYVGPPVLTEAQNKWFNKYGDSVNIQGQKE